MILKKRRQQLIKWLIISKTDGENNAVNKKTTTDQERT